MTTSLGSILLASTDPDRLRAWYCAAFDVVPTPDNFLVIGDVGVLVDGRDDVAEDSVEPARVILNFHVDDLQSAVTRLRDQNAPFLAEPEWRGQAGFATAIDPDGNYVQVIELSREYYTSRQLPPPRSGTTQLALGEVAARLPAQDLDRARRWYADKLGLEPAQERPGGLRYQFGHTWFGLFASSGAASSEHTQMGWKVADLEATVAELKDRGVVFEEYDLPGMKTVAGIATVEGAYPCDGGKGELAAWFKDSEGNLIGLGQPL
jgi:predicted enzyme related to lactoylglutathione lyase